MPVDYDALAAQHGGTAVGTYVTPSTGGMAKGMISPGNVDLSKRPSIDNGDGTHSTVFSMGVNIGGKEMLIPGVGDGKTYPLRKLSVPEAVDQYKKTGQHLGVFASPDASDAYAQTLHEDQARGNKAIDYDALAAQHGGTAVQSPQAEPEGFFRSLGDTFGIPNGQQPKPTVGQAVTDAVLGPAKSLYEQGKASFDQLRQANQARKEGNTAGVIQHGISAVPIVGPAMDKLVDQQPTPRPGQSYLSQVGDTLTNPGSLGTLTGTAAQLAPIALGAADAAGIPRPNSTLPNVIDKFPTRAKAGEIFNQLNTKLADQPVPLAKSAAPLQRAIEVAARGGTMPNAVSAFLQRSQAIEPMTFPEIRDYQGSLSDLSASDKMAMNGRMRGAVAQLNHALYQDIRQAAETQGMGADYDKAMAQYKLASQIRNGVGTAGEIAGKAAATAALGSVGYSLIKQIQESR